ncbi:MAG: TAXI family TRAP transporter solute-binding subunit [Ignavibacteriales bacterium]
MLKRLVFLAVAACLMVTVVAGCSSAPARPAEPPKQQEQKPQETQAPKTTGLPEMVNIATLGAGSSGYNQTSALAEGIQSVTKSKVRIIPTGNPINRVSQLVSGSVGYFVGYDEVYLSTEGMAEYATMNLGPMDLRSVLGNRMGLTMVTTARSGIKTPYDFKGKRVPYVPGDSSVGYKTSALLAFGGYTWDDVKPVPYPAWVESVKGLVAGTCDIAQQACPPSSVIYELASTPQGVNYPIYAHNDKEGWARLHEWAPWIFPMKMDSKDLVGLKPGEAIEMAGYNAPTLVALASRDENEVYALVKALDESFNTYKDALPEMKGWSIKTAAKPPLPAPLHNGTIKYLKEKGLWTAEDEAWNNAAIDRVKKVQEAFQTVKVEAQSKNIKPEEFEAYWMKRKQELVGGFCKMLPDFMKKK